MSDKDLNPLLDQASNEDLATLVDYLTEKTSEELTSKEIYKKHYPNHKKYTGLIAQEIRAMGGNTFANLFRKGEGPSYKEVVFDVADKLKAPYKKSRPIEDVENSILETIMVRALEKMKKKEINKLMDDVGLKDMELEHNVIESFQQALRVGGFYSYQLTLIISNQITQAVLGKKRAKKADANLKKVTSIALGPMGWNVLRTWKSFDVAGPAYSITIPMVVHIAMLRKKQQLDL